MNVQCNTKQGRLYIQRNVINKSAFIFQKISCDCVRQLCKTNGTIETHNKLKRERRVRKEKERTEEERERKIKEKKGERKEKKREENGREKKNGGIENR